MYTAMAVYAMLLMIIACAVENVSRKFLVITIILSIAFFLAALGLEGVG